METVEVGSKPEGVSWVGALDMSGNVGEWTSSTYQDYPYDAADGRENDGGYSSRVLRGGSHAGGSLELRAADRLMYTPMGKGWLHGARCARTFDDSSPEEGSTPLEGHTTEGDNVTFVFDQAVYG
jgi:iron(II)-dependent oxidoreductase